MTKTMDLSKKQRLKASKIKDSLKPVSFGIVIAMWFVYIALLIVNLMAFPDLRGDYTAFIYYLGVLIRPWCPFLLLAVMIAICVMLAKTRTQPFRFLTRYAILVFVLTIYPLPYVFLNLPMMVSLILLAFLFVPPITSFGRYICNKRSMSPSERRQYEKKKVQRVEQDVEVQKKYGIVGIVIGIATTIPALVAATASSMTNLTFFCMVITFLVSLPMGLITTIVLTIRFIKTNRRMDNTAFLLNIAGIVLCLLPLVVVLFQLFTS